MRTFYILQVYKALLLVVLLFLKQLNKFGLFYNVM